MTKLDGPEPIVSDENTSLTFWEHLDILRTSIIKMLGVTIVAAIVAFLFKDELFYIILAPKNADFITYKLLGDGGFNIQLVNIGLTEQFMIHLKTAFWFGFIVASPFVIYFLYRFIAPALYVNERKYSVRIVSSGYIMFMMGILVNYFLIFPLTVRFLGTYSVSPSVHNLLSLQSYTDTLLMMSLIFGIVFELPVVSWLLAKFGLLKAEWMTQYRRHAYVVILFIAAIITPTSDMFTMIVVSIPIIILYEASILVVKLARTKSDPE